MSTETLTFQNDFTPLDLLLYKRYRVEVAGLVEATLDLNPGLADLAAFPPRGTTIIVTTPTPASKKVVRKTVRLFS
jgi:phage tail protein X